MNTLLREVQMPNWTAAEEEVLIARARAGDSWDQIAALIPERSRAACQSHAHKLRKHGVKMTSPDRRKPQGSGAGAGRPPNRRKGYNVNTKVPRDERDAFIALSDATGLKPGKLLTRALESYLRAVEWPDIGEGVAGPFAVDSPLVMVCWRVPDCVLVQARRAMDDPKLSKPQAGRVALRAVLEEYGFTATGEK